MTTLQFFLPMIPPTTTHQMKKVTVGKGGKVRFYEPADLKDARAKLMAHLAGHVPEEEFARPLQVTVKWLFPIPDRRVKPADGSWAIEAPDTHNLNKLLFDCMTALGYWTDDKIVCREIIEKFWTTTPGIFISVLCLDVS